MTGQDLEARPKELANPVTGELIALDATTDVLAGELDALKETESRIRSYKRAINDELLARMDKEARWSWKGGGLKLTGQSPSRVEYDGEKLWHELEPLVREEVIGEHAFAEAVERAWAYKAKVRGVNALLKLPSERVRAAIARARLEPKSRSVAVTRG